MVKIALNVHNNKFPPKNLRGELFYYIFVKNKNLGTFNTPEEAFEAYKQVKEVYIKELTNKYKEQITEACYQALINYKIEITD